MKYNLFLRTLDFFNHWRDANKISTRRHAFFPGFNLYPTQHIIFPSSLQKKNKTTNISKLNGQNNISKTVIERPVILT